MPKLKPPVDNTADLAAIGTADIAALEQYLLSMKGYERIGNEWKATGRVNYRNSRLTIKEAIQFWGATDES